MKQVQAAYWRKRRYPFCAICLSLTKKKALEAKAKVSVMALAGIQSI